MRGYEQDAACAKASFAEGQPTAPVNGTSFHTLDRTLGVAMALAQRVCVLSERLTGGVPRGDVSKTDRLSRGGVFGALETQYQSVDASLRAAFDALEAIERELP